MKKILLPGMLATIAFAACTNEELVPQQTTVPEFDLSSRPVVGQVDLVFGPQTRMGLGTGYNGFEFAATDKLGARLIDEVNTGKLNYKNHQFRYKAAVNNVAYSNYAYEKQADGSWGTEALLVEGNYMFYAPYDAEARDRSALGVTFPIVQNIDPTSTDKVKTEKGDLDANVDAIQEFFSGENGHTAFIGHYFLDASKDIDGITPAYNHLYAYPVITLTNDYKVSKAGELVGEKITINRVIISSSNIYSNYTVNNEGIMDALRNSAVEYKDNGVDVKESQALGWWRTKDGANAKNFLLGAKTTDMLDEITSGKDVKNGTITVVFNPALEIEAGESFSFHVVMPAAEYAASNLSITPVYTEKEKVEWTWSDDEFVKDAATYTFAPGMWCPSEEYNVEGSKPAYKATAGSLTEYSIKGAMERYQEPAKDLKSLDEFVAWLEKNNFDHSIDLVEGNTTFTFAKEKVKIDGVEEEYSVVPFNRALMDVVKKYLVTGTIKFTTNMLATGDLTGDYAVDGNKYQFAGGLDQKDGKIALSNATVAGNSRFFGEANLTNVTINGAAVFNGKATLTKVTANGTTIKGAGSVVDGESVLGAAVIEKNTEIKGKAKATALTIKGATVDYNSENSCGAITVQENATLNMNKSYAAAITVGAQVGDNMTAGTLNVKADQANAITVNKGNVTIDEGKTVNNLAWTSKSGATLTNNGTIKCDLTVPNNSTYIHYGNVTGDVTVPVAEKDQVAGIIENYGDITVEENNGKIIAETKDTHTTVEAGTGIIGNDKQAYVSANAGQTVYYTFTDEVNSAILANFDAKTYSINKLIFEGGLNIDANITEPTLVENVKTIEFNTDKGIYVKENVKANLGVDVVEVTANTSFGGFEKSKSRISFAKSIDINVAAGKTLTVQYLTMATTAEANKVNINLLKEGNSTATLKVVNADVLVGQAYVPVYTSSANGTVNSGFYNPLTGKPEVKNMVIDGDTYEVYSFVGLKQVVEAINASTGTSWGYFEGKTIKLMNNIDMNNEEWTPIVHFNGTFDGNNKTIYNLNVKASTTAAKYVGFFTRLGNCATVKKLTIDGATVNGNHFVGAVTGYSYGLIDGCTVKNATINCTVFEDANGNVIEDGDDAGTITGFNGETFGVITNCKAINCTVNAAEDAGQIVGTAFESQVTMCSVDNVTVVGAGTKNRNNTIISRNLSLE